MKAGFGGFTLYVLRVAILANFRGPQRTSVVLGVGSLRRITLTSGEGRTSVQIVGALQLNHNHVPTRVRLV